MVMQLASRVTQPQALRTRLGERLQSSSLFTTQVPLQGKISAKSFPVASFPTMGKPLLSLLLFRIREKAREGRGGHCVSCHASGRWQEQIFSSVFNIFCRSGRQASSSLWPLLNMNNQHFPPKHKSQPVIHNFFQTRQFPTSSPVLFHISFSARCSKIHLKKTNKQGSKNFKKLSFLCATHTHTDRKLWEMHL